MRLQFLVIEDSAEGKELVCGWKGVDRVYDVNRTLLKFST